MTRFARSLIGSALVALVPTVVRAGTDAAPNATPTPAQSAQAAQQAALERDFAELARQDAAERARLTPEVRAAAKALAEKDYPDGRSAVAAVLQGPHRAPGNAARDGQRHPQETLELFGFAPDLTVLEYGPGEGWYTEILAPALARRGKLYVTTPDPDGPKDQRPTLYAQRTKLFLESGNDSGNGRLRKAHAFSRGSETPRARDANKEPESRNAVAHTSFELTAQDYPGNWSARQ